MKRLSGEMEGERKMFAKDDLIVYGSTGVCRVEGVGLPEYRPTPDDETLYYKLAPVYSVGYIYIPVDTPVYMRPVMTREQAERLIDAIVQVEPKNLVGLDTRTLTEKYKTTLSHEDPRALICLIKSVKDKTQKAIARGRRPGKIDKDYMKRARELLYGELAVSLEIPLDDVDGYIHERMGEVLEEAEEAIAE